MTKSVERLITRTPGRMASQPAQWKRTHSFCVLPHLHAEDLELTLCDALTDAENRLQARADQQSFQLHVQFVRAHGLPKGEVTVLSTGGVFCSGAEMRR